MEGLLAAAHGTLVATWLAMDGLDVHEKVVADTEATPTFLALRGGGGEGYVCVCVCV